MRSTAVAIVLLSVREGTLSVVLLRRPGNRWGLPGSELADTEGLEQAAAEVLRRDAGALPNAIEQLYTFDVPADRLTVAYLALGTPERSPLTPGPGIVEVRWFAVSEVPPLESPDHLALAVATERLRGKAAYAPVALSMLPGAFTLAELQTVYEAALGASLDARNFRRDVLAAGLVEPTGGTRPGPGRPAKLYQAGGGLLSLGERERRLAGSLTPAGGDPQEV